MVDLFNIRYNLNRYFRIRQIKEIHQQLDIIKNGDLVFEIGSYDGMVGKALHSLGATVVMVEPMPDMCEKIRQRFKGEKNWKLEEAGVGSSEGKATLKICSNGMASTFSEKFASNTITEEKQTYKKTVEARITTLSALIEKYGTPRYVKMDAEGFELQILSGLEQPIDYVCFEFHKGMMQDTRKCVQHLENLAKYEYVATDWHSPPHRMTPVGALNKAEMMRGGDMIAIKRTGERR